MLGEPGFPTWTGVGDVEVGQVPVFDQLAKLADNLVLAELSKPLEREDVARLEFLLLPDRLGASLLVFVLICDRSTSAVRKVEEMPRLAVLTSPILQKLG